MLVSIGSIAIAAGSPMPSDGARSKIGVQLFAAVPREPDASPRRADVNHLGVVRIDGDRGDLAVGGDRP